MNTITGTNAYAKVAVESGVQGADPHQLIAMLYQGALLAIANARNGMLHKDIAAKGKAISHAARIIDEGLKASLNKDVGGKLAHDLDALYDYMLMRLVEANVNNDITLLDEVARLLGEIKGAWDSIRPTVVAQSSAQQPATMNEKPATLTYGRG